MTGRHRPVQPADELAADSCHRVVVVEQRQRGPRAHALEEHRARRVELEHANCAVAVPHTKCIRLVVGFAVRNRDLEHGRFTRRATDDQ